MMSNNSANSSDSNVTGGNLTTQKLWLLETNCREDWPRWSCIFFNLCGLNSTAVWFIVLFPQVVKNFKRRSIHGLSILWALANFTASFVNLFFVFSIDEMPIYVKVSTVYMPILEMFLLIQFLVYDQTCPLKKKIIYSLICSISWATIAVVTLVFSLADKLVWISIFFWSTQTLFQVFLNMRLRSTQGQSTVSVTLAMIGKLTDFLSIYGLRMPIQYVTSIFFSSSVAYTNGIQVVWYWGISLINGSSPDPIKISLTPLRCAILCYMLTAQIFYALGIVWNLNTYWAIIAPVGLVALYTNGYFIIVCLRKRIRRKNRRPSLEVRKEGVNENQHNELVKEINAD